MTGRELLDYLKTLMSEVLELPVYSEGCDCDEPAIGVDIDGQVILIARREPEWTAPSDVEKARKQQEYYEQLRKEWEARRPIGPPDPRLP